MPERDSGWLSGNVVDAEDARLATGVFASGGAGAVQNRSGLKPFPFAGRVIAASPASGQVQVGPFQAVLQGTRSPSAGSYLVTLDQTKTIDVLGAVPAHQSFARVDLIVVRQTDAQYGDTSSALTVGHIAGTPAETPAEPTVAGDHIVLARINVPANATAIDTAQILDRRVFTAAVGGIIPIASATARPVAPYSGQAAYRQELRLLEVYDGQRWEPAATNSIATYGPNDAGWPQGISAGADSAKVFNRLTVPAVYFPRTLYVTAQAIIDSTSNVDRYDCTLSANGSVVGLSVVNSGPGAGMNTVVLTALVSQPANTVMTLKVALQRMDGTGAAGAGWGYPYDSINVLAIPTAR